ncbi:hypothetical protein IWW42_002311 [Coemansia sp. RSA 1085]|nr:hypothetical protein IWW42_002311 [Coemansia sp. RSA 1085]
MAELAFGHTAEQELATPYTQQFYPVLGVLNGPSSTAAESKLTAYGRQVGRTMLKYFRGSDIGQAADSNSDYISTGWDPVGPGRGPRWQTVPFERVDDIPRRKSRTQQAADQREDLSPRSTGGTLSGEGLMTPKWVERQQQRPATVISLHMLQDGADSRLAEEMARNRVCLAAFGITYTAVVIINRGAAEDNTEARLSAIMQRGGLEAPQFAVCRPGSAPQFQRFLSELERSMFARAATFYADAFMRSQRKLAQIPQLPLPERPEDLESVRQSLIGTSESRVQSLKLMGEETVVRRYSRFLPLRGWLVRYHFKLGVFAECSGDRDTAQRCMWLAYVHLATYLGEIAAGAYLPQTESAPGSGWMWELNGSDSDGQRAQRLRMFGQRWDEALQLLEALHVRLVRGWLYQSLDVNALRATQSGSSGGWSYSFGGGGSGTAQRYTVAPVYRSGPSAVAAPAASRAPVPISPGGSSPVSPSLANTAGGNGSLDSLVLSVHAGEVSAATEQLMDAERARRKGGAAGTVSYVSLGSETRDIDLLELQESRGRGWWPLGGFYAVVDFGRGQQTSRMGLVLNSSQDVGCTASMLPAENPYDTSLTLAGRQCAEHVVLLARVLQHSGFGEDSSYFWACLERQYCLNAAVYLLAAGHGMGFARALNRALLRLNSDSASTVAADAQVSNMFMSSLRQPLPARATASAEAVAKPHGRQRAPSTAFSGFAFDQALGSIYAVVEPKRASDAVSATTAASGEDSLFPQWMWPESAAPLFDAAALASLKRCRQLAVETEVYGPDASSKDRQRQFSANPGVENTYMSAWLNAERQRSSNAQTGSRACHLLAAALACTDGSSQAVHAAQAVAAQVRDLEPLIKLVASREHGPAHFYMHLASEIAEVYAEAELYAPALQVFKTLADQFRAEGWSQLTAHALQWIYKCAMSTKDQETAVSAAVELLSPQLGISESERVQLESELPSMTAGMAMSIDMARIYAPIRCHAQWRHWELGESEIMHFQIAMDCGSMRNKLRLKALTIEFSDPQFNIVVSSTSRMSVSDVEFASWHQKARLHDLDCDGSTNALELQPECVSVFQGSVDFGGADSWRWQNGILAIERVTADVASGSNDQKQQSGLQLQWTTCAAALPEDSGKADESFAENALARIEKQLLGNIGVDRVRRPSLVAQSPLKLKLPLPSDDEVPALKRAIRVTGPTSSLPQHYKWLHKLQDGSKAQWMQLPIPPLIAGSASEPAFSTYSRCRVLAFPKAKPALEISLPSVKALTPAYYGEAFPVEIEVRNTHATRQLADVVVDLQLRVIDPNTEPEDDILVKESSQADAQGSTEHGGLAAMPWLQLCQENDKSAKAVHKIEGISCGDLLPLKCHTFTVHIHFPDAALHGIRRVSTESSVTTLQCIARYSNKSQEDTESVSVQAAIPAVRPLCAEVESMPSHVPAPAYVESVDSASITSSGYAAATAISGTGECCFRRPVRVQLRNSGPWAVDIKRIALRPPLLDPDGIGALPLRVQVAASTAWEHGVLEAKSSQEQVVWLDIYTSDVVRMPEEVCPGTLEVQWRRFDGDTVLTRMWLPPLRLVQRCLQVEMSPSEAVAQVGQPMLLNYRLLNVTRKVQTVEVAMHAVDGFVFAGPRRTTLTLLPGDVGLMRFNVLPLAPLAVPENSNGAAKHVPNLALLGLPSQQTRTDKGVPSNATGLGWVLLPRLEVRIADAHGPRSRASSMHSPTSPSATTLRSLASSAVAAVAGTPPPTRELSSLSLDPPANHTQEAQLKIALLAGLSVEDAASLSPELAASCVEMLPAYVLDESIVAGAESDFEDDNDPAPVQLPPPAASTEDSAAADEIVRAIKSQQSLVKPSNSGDESMSELFPWKLPDLASEGKTQASNGNSRSKLEDSDDGEERWTDVVLERLPGWPSEFPPNLTEYREQVLNTTKWKTDYEKHRAEIAPWVWHHRGQADVLEAELVGKSSKEAAAEMARLGLLPSAGRQANASFVVLIRNRELDDFLDTMRQLEDRFNHRYHYPYLFLNDQPFTRSFMQAVAASTTSNVTFALIPRDHWSLPSFIDREQARQAREQMARNNVVYGGSLSYRHMCRFNSGFFYKHPLLQDVDWYWRVEPGVDFYCDLDYDPFAFMEQQGKLYSFVITLKEISDTIPTLWDHTLQFMLNHNVTSDWMSYFVSRSGNYNLCHFWSNFEIASLNWLRSPEYNAYFDYLDRAKGFFMERWGDAPVHSLAAGMLLRRDQVHFFDDIGYRHDEFARCPELADREMHLRCRCPKNMVNFDTNSGSCLPRWKASGSAVSWTERDTREALRLSRERRLFTSGMEPQIAVERRRWYNFFGEFP